jgi:hypothetical protein
MSDNFKKNKSKECLIEEYLCNITSKCESQIPIYKEKKNKLNNKEIKIPTIKSYNELYSNNYNITQLKSFAKHYKLKISGNKQELINRIYIFLYFSSYIIKIQKHFRRTLVKKYKNLHGPASINRKLCTNKNDFITLDPIEEINFHQFLVYYLLEKGGIYLIQMSLEFMIKIVN